MTLVTVLSSLKLRLSAVAGVMFAVFVDITQRELRALLVVDDMTGKPIFTEVSFAYDHYIIANDIFRMFLGKAKLYSTPSRQKAIPQRLVFAEELLCHLIAPSLPAHVH